MRLVGWLYVKVIVDSDGRIRRIDGQLAKHHRIARCLDDLHGGPTGLEDRGSLVRTLSDIRGMRRVHTHGRNLDQLAQQCLKLLTCCRDSLLQSRIQVGGHMMSPFQQARTFREPPSCAGTIA